MKNKISIKGEYIKLGALLKFAGITLSGGEAQMLIKNGEVLLNGEICTERGKKVHIGDEISAAGEVLQIVGEE